VRAIVKRSLIDALIAFVLVTVLERVLFPEPRQPDITHITIFPPQGQDTAEHDQDAG